MNKKIALVTGGTPNLAGPSGTLFLSLKLMSPQLYEQSDKYFLSSDRVNSKSVKALEKIGVSVELFDAKLSSSASGYIKYFTKGILAKFEIFRLARFYDRVIWFDSDQICVRELHDEVNSISNSFAITDGGKSSFGLSNFIEDPVDSISYCADNNISLNNQGLCGNFFWINQLNDDQLYNESRSLFSDLAHELYGGEQGIIYILREKYFSDYLPLDHSLYTPHPREWPLERLLSSDVINTPFFIHAYSQPKFWNGFNCLIWNYFYDIWVSYGGEKFKPSSSHATRFRQSIKLLAKKIATIDLFS